MAAMDLKTPQNDEPSDKSSDPADLKTYQLNLGVS